MKTICKKCKIEFTPKSKDCNKFCSRSCSVSFNNSYRKIKRYCKKCSKELDNEKNQRSFCSHDCQKEYQKEEALKRWKLNEWDGLTKSGKYLSEHIRGYLFNKYNNSCQKCGWNKTNLQTKIVPLHIHHKDGNYRNNLEENLEVLCPNCHSLTPNYGGSNKGNGRDYRYKQ
jgi:hypothetical protein